MTPSPVANPTPTQKPDDLKQQIIERRRASYNWLHQNFYDQWRRVHRLYKCEVDPATDENQTGRMTSGLVDSSGHRIGSPTDTTKTRIGMPDTWSLVQRQVSRITAQPPNLKFRADDQDLAKKISRKLMYDWDRGGVQRGQKRHCSQGCLFGISVRAWSWEAIELQRMTRVDPTQAQFGDPTHQAIMDQYGDSLGRYQQEHGMEPGSPESLGMLMGDHSRGGLLPINKSFKKYEGPKASFLFIGDCFFEPNFQSLQTSNWFIVARRRNRRWLNRMAAQYQEMQPGIEQLLRDNPKGTIEQAISHEGQNLRIQMQGDIDRVDTSRMSIGDTEMWTVTEMWTPGENMGVSYVAEDKIWLGHVDQPYNLDGKIPFTELVLIDDILTGIGDSHARIMRGLNELHNDHNNLRYDLVNCLLRPLVFTTDRELYDNPDSIKRGDGMRLVYSRNPNALTPLNEGAAIASAAAGMKDEEGILRMFQMGTGESNMSMQANVDPAQNRTATGARVQAFNQDILSRAANDMFNVALNADAEMMYLLNRSEMPEAVTFDAAQYTRSYGPSMSAPPVQPPADPNAPPMPSGQMPQQDMMTVSPLDFQIDGEVEAEIGSTLADDDETEVIKAQNMFSLAVANPTLVNVLKARDNLVTRFGYGRDLAAWQAPPPPPPMPPPPEPARVALSVAAKFELLPPDVQVSVLEKASMPVPPELMALAQAAQQGIPPEAPPEPQPGTLPAPGGPAPMPPPVAAGPPLPRPRPNRKPPGHMPKLLDLANPQPPTALQAAMDIKPGMPTQ